MKIYEKYPKLDYSSFEKDGEYLIEHKPKYKYEIKIIHDHSKEKNNLKSKTPDKINFNNFTQNQLTERNKSYTKIDIFNNSYESLNKKCRCEKELYNIIKGSLYKIENEKNYKKYSGQRKKIPHFRNPLKIEKQIQQYIHPSMNKIKYHISEVNLNNFISVRNNNIIYITSHKNKKSKLNQNDKFIYRTPDKNIYNNNKKNSNNSFISNNDSEICNYNISINLKNKGRNNYRNKNKTDELMIHKSSERKKIIKSVPLGKKINPLILKKTVFKPILQTIQNENYPPRKVIKQTSILTSIETNPLYLRINNPSKKREKSFINQKITNVYTTLSKNVLNKSFDDIKPHKKGNLIYKRHIIHNKQIRRKNYIQFFNKNDNNNNNYCSLTSNMYEQIEPNKVIKIKEEIKCIKDLLSSKNDDKLNSLKNYFLNLSDEEKIGILTNLKKNREEEDKIYNKLIDILKEKGIKENSSIT